MGLDNVFRLRNKKTGIQIDLFHFRNYYELADYFRRFEMLPKSNGTNEQSYEYAVTHENLTTLQRLLEPAYNLLIKLPLNTVTYYDDMGYPEQYHKLLYGEDFNPASSQSSFAGINLLNLYQRIDSLLEILDSIQTVWYNNEQIQGEYEIIFCDSY